MTKHLPKIASLLFFLFAFLPQQVFSQSITAKIIDGQTGESIPYANIIVNNSENLVSNSEGYFTLSEKNSDDAVQLLVSYLGYANQTLTVAELKRNQNKISLQPGMIELSDVTLNEKKLTALQIMANVKANLKNNYSTKKEATKDKIFFRESSYLAPKILDVEIDKSTGFTKDGLKKANQQINAFTSKLVTNPPKEYTDILCDYYHSVTQKEKMVYSTKMDVIKATKLKNENNAVSLDELEKSAVNILLTHLDTTKYYRIKSGWFGSRDTISLRKDFNKKKNKTKNTRLSSAKTQLSMFMYENSMTNTQKFNFIDNHELYDYKYEGAKYSNDNEFIYVVSFKPRKSKAKYVGKLYIAESDFAVLRVDYNLAEGKKEGGFNMKLLLGVKSLENVSNGTIIYKKSPSDNGYHLHYVSQETGQYIYLNRPLKFIELTDEEKDVVAFDLKLEANQREKIEFLNIARSEIDHADVEKIKEEEFNFIKLKAYDASIWKNYIAIEPLAEMKQFKAED